MLSTVVALTSFSGAPVARSVTRAAGVAMETREDLKALAVKCNPTVGYWDPLDVCEAFGDYPSTETATVGWFRHAEIKHGRVAMAAFVGFCVQSNGIHFPWGLTGGAFEGAFGGPSISFGDIAAAGGPGAQWDALPAEAKIQIICAVGFLEVIGELSPVLEANGEKHYVKGGKPGYYPPFNGFFNKEYWPHPLPLNLWDPFGTPWTRPRARPPARRSHPAALTPHPPRSPGFTKKMSAERKAKALVAEINNGRLAMIGIFGMLSASKGLIVPGLDGISGIAKYSGEYMAPFVAADGGALPLVTDMAGLIVRANPTRPPASLHPRSPLSSPPTGQPRLHDLSARSPRHHACVGHLNLLYL